MAALDNPLGEAGRPGRAGLGLLRIAIAVVFLWIGALEFAPYEADSSTPVVANGPIQSYVYDHAVQSGAHRTHEGELIPTRWERRAINSTYASSRGLGAMEITVGVLVLLAPVTAPLGLLGALLAFLAPLATRSLVLAMPGPWVPDLGEPGQSVPHGSGAARLVVTNFVLLAGASVVLADSARAVRLRYAGGLGHQTAVLAPAASADHLESGNRSEPGRQDISPPRRPAERRHPATRKWAASPRPPAPW